MTVHGKALAVLIPGFICVTNIVGRVKHGVEFTKTMIVNVESRTICTIIEVLGGQALIRQLGRVLD